MFQADFKVAVLDNIEIDDIREAMEAIANDLVVDIEFD
jgi:glycine cleavage system regulatory protein